MQHILQNGFFRFLASILFSVDSFLDFSSNFIFCPVEIDFFSLNPSFHMISSHWAKIREGAKLARTLFYWHFEFPLVEIRVFSISHFFFFKSYTNFLDSDSMTDTKTRSSISLKGSAQLIQEFFRGFSEYFRNSKWILRKIPFPKLFSSNWP